MQYQFKINIFNHEMLMAVKEFIESTKVECEYPDLENVDGYPLSVFVDIGIQSAVFKFVPFTDSVEGNQIALLDMKWNMPFPTNLVYKVGEIMAKYRYDEVDVSQLSGGELLFYGLYNIPLDSVAGDTGDDRTIMLTCIDMYDHQ